MRKTQVWVGYTNSNHLHVPSLQFTGETTWRRRRRLGLEVFTPIAIIGGLVERNLLLLTEYGVHGGCRLGREGVGGRWSRRVGKRSSHSAQLTKGRTRSVKYGRRTRDSQARGRSACGTLCKRWTRRMGGAETLNSSSASSVGISGPVVDVGRVLPRRALAGWPLAGLFEGGRCKESCVWIDKGKSPSSWQ